MLPVVVVSREMGIPIAGVLVVFGGLSVAVGARRRAGAVVMVARGCRVALGQLLTALAVAWQS